MCGICGFAGTGDVDILASMNETMVHRGPDAGGLWHDAREAVYLGHRRLSIIDLSGGAQPMWTADGKLGIVYNGEIYNHLELRDELIRAGHIFLTDHCRYGGAAPRLPAVGRGICLTSQRHVGLCPLRPE